MLSNQQLIDEWRKHDPFLLDLDEFERFCEIRLSGTLYPLDPEDIFLTVEPIRREWSLDRFPGGPINCIEYNLRDCIPRESADDYWERNDKASWAVRELVASYTGKDALRLPLHLNESALQLIKDTFGITLTKQDYEEAWKLFEHKEWFDESGYYVRGWLAVAEALGIGRASAKLLETTPYPHRDKPQVKEEGLCEHMKICPIYHYREWLRVMPIDIPDDVFNYNLFQSNCRYYIRKIEDEWFKQGRKEEVLKVVNDPNLSFKVKWKIRKMIRDYLKFPRCKNCGEISYHPGRFQVELCWRCQQLVDKAYRTRVNPLAGDYGFLPEHVEQELRQKLVEGDPIFDGVTG